MKKQKILIVEDHKTLRAGLRMWLQISYPECQIFEVDNGQDALNFALDANIDLMLVDIGLPDVNGIEVTRQVKAAKPSTTIVVVSIHDGLNYQQDALAAGASAFVSKKDMSVALLPVLKQVWTNANGALTPGEQKEGEKVHEQS